MNGAVRDNRSLTLLTDEFCLGRSPRWFEGLLWFADPVGQAVRTVDLRGSTTALPLTGRTPCGLGFRPDGALLIASGIDRRLLCYDGESVVVAADLGDTAGADLTDMIVDGRGRAFVGCASGRMLRVDPDGRVTVTVDGLDSPRGMAITPDGDTLLVAESGARRLTAFDIEPGGSLSGRTVFADRLGDPPDGIALDADGALWVAATGSPRFHRILNGGSITDSIDLGERNAVACALGGPERRVLFLLSTADAYPRHPAGTPPSRLDAVTVEVPGAGLP